MLIPLYSFISRPTNADVIFIAILLKSSGAFHAAGTALPTLPLKREALGALYRLSLRAMRHGSIAYTA
jgi:hypothetical protein